MPTSYARWIALILAATALTSGWFAYKQWTELKSAQRSVSREQAKLDAARKEQTMLARELTPGGELRPLDAAVAQSLAVVNRFRTEHRVQVSAIAPAKGSVAAKVTPLEVSEPVGASRMRVAKFVVRGSYMEYEQFLAYLEALRVNGVAIGALKVSLNTFELGIRVYGR